MYCGINIYRRSMFVDFMGYPLPQIYVCMNKLITKVMNCLTIHC